MDRLALFIPLAKADAARRLVYGHFDETPDRAGEVFDYASSKPHIAAWSGGIAKASDGKSYGNIRAQHGRNACGKLVDISFDDELKKVGFVAKIVDDDEWRKVEEGVYTGFSPGGRYAKRWQDGAVKRYTADVRELSIVDVPCNPAATFTMIKADGAEEPVRFILAKAYEPGNDATLDRAAALAQAAGRAGRRNDFVAKARAELIAENADEALAKMADAPPPDDASTAAPATESGTSDADQIQSIHDNAVCLGAVCTPAEKDALAAIVADRDRLAKAVEESAPRVEALTERLTQALAEIEMLRRQPQPAKGQLIAMEKSAVPAERGETLAERIAALPNGPVKQAAILASVGAARR
ncbi:hypothetical protein [Sphingomonas sp. MMS24-J13]|uniref:hypothetical protein n=1 Tax=Sphingomonas sp. MMS24-J13 TaxID=3238686 RepID=UPI00384CE98A